jgi:hypothetical protein
MLASFLSSRTARDHLSTVPLRTLHQAYLAALPAADRAAWQRGRFVAELGAAGYEIAIVDRVYQVVGLAMDEAVA